MRYPWHEFLFIPILPIFRFTKCRLWYWWKKIKTIFGRVIKFLLISDSWTRSSLTYCSSSYLFSFYFPKVNINREQNWGILCNLTRNAYPFSSIFDLKWKGCIACNLDWILEFVNHFAKVYIYKCTKGFNNCCLFFKHC